MHVIAKILIDIFIIFLSLTVAQDSAKRTYIYLEMQGFQIRLIHEVK